MGVGRVTRRAKEVFISKSVRPYRVSASTVVTLHYCCHPAAFENDGLSEPTFTVFATLVQLRAGPCFAALHMSALGVRSCKFPFSSKLVTPAGSGGGDIPVAASDWLGRSAWVIWAVVHATGHGHRTNDSRRSHRCCADAPDHRGLVGRVSGRANGDGYRPGRSGGDADLRC